MNDDIYDWNIHKLWNKFNIIQEETGQYTEQKKQIKNGIHLHIPIHYIINGHYTTRPQYKTVSIQGYGKVNYETFYKEVEEREQLMRQIIITEEEAQESLQS